MDSQDPQSPEFGGQCAFALSTCKKGVAGRTTTYLIQDGKKYVFSNPVAKLLWRLLPGRKKKAESYWPDQ